MSGSSNASLTRKFGLFWTGYSMTGPCAYVDWKEPTVNGELYPGNFFNPCVIMISFEMDGATLEEVQWSVRRGGILGDQTGIVAFDHVDPANPSDYSRRLAIGGKATRGSYYAVFVKIKHEYGTCRKQFKIAVKDPPQQGPLRVQIKDGATIFEGVEVTGGSLSVGGRVVENVPAQIVASGDGFLVAKIGWNEEGKAEVQSITWKAEKPKFWTSPAEATVEAGSKVPGYYQMVIAEGTTGAVGDDDQQIQRTLTSWVRTNDA